MAKVFLPPDATPGDVAACRAPTNPPRPAAPTIGGKGLPPSMRAHGKATQARAHVELCRGAWKVRCPFCTYLQPLRHEEQFVCVLCHGGTAGGRWTDVLWPHPEWVPWLFRMLAPRPAENRNWIPGETLADLAAENAAHGVSHVG